MRVTLLGTGTPVPSADRFGYSTLIEAGGPSYCSISVAA
jgi:ribonuclease Z